jgi:cytochrome c biogenesis protein CcdA
VFLIVVVVSVAAIDALNPSTVLPALLFALGRHAVRDVAAFTAGVFAVSVIGGVVLVFGPGRALLGLVSHPSHHVVHILEVLAGVALLGVALFLWVTREQVRVRLSQERRRAGGGSAFLIGAGIMATELPTALPYFGVLIAITEGTQGNLASLTLVILYNVVFVAPLLAVLVVVLVAGERGAHWAARMRQRLIKHAPTVLPILVAALGAALIVAAFLS